MLTTASRLNSAPAERMLWPCLLLANPKVLKFVDPICLLGRQKAGGTSARKSTPRTLKEIRQQYPAVLANPPALVGISTSYALVMAASHPLAEQPGTWGVCEATPALEGTSLDSTTSPMVSLPPPGLLCGDLACEARSAPTAPTGSAAGAARVSPPPRTRSSPR
jgi:hypothetical protein